MRDTKGGIKMGKLIYMDDEGNSETIREDIRKEDVLIKSDYLAVQIWMDEDIAKKLDEMGFAPSDENVAIVRDYTDIGEWLEEATECDWDKIEYSISDCDDKLKR